jgi:hypothetical protein
MDIGGQPSGALRVEFRSRELQMNPSFSWPRTLHSRRRLCSGALAALAIVFAASDGSSQTINVRVAAEPSTEVVRYVAKVGQAAEIVVGSADRRSAEDLASEQCGYVSDAFIEALGARNKKPNATRKDTLGDFALALARANSTEASGDLPVEVPSCLRYSPERVSYIVKPADNPWKIAKQAGLANFDIFAQAAFNKSLLDLNQKMRCPGADGKSVEKKMRDRGGEPILEIGCTIVLPVAKAPSVLHVAASEAEVVKELNKLLPALLAASGPAAAIERRTESETGDFVLGHTAAKDVPSCEPPDFDWAAHEELKEAIALARKMVTQAPQAPKARPWIGMRIIDTGLRSYSDTSSFGNFVLVDEHIEETCEPDKDFHCTRYGATIDTTGKIDPETCQGAPAPMHGTWVSTIALGGVAANGGLPQASTLPVRLRHFRLVNACTGDRQNGNVGASSFSEAVRWLLDKDKADPDRVPLFNVSWAFDKPDVVRPTLEHLKQRGALTVVAAGNDGKDLGQWTPDTGPWPAMSGGVDTTHVVTVGSVRKDRLAPAAKSNHGKYVDIYAPGECVPVSSDLKKVEGVTGTSFAAPRVSLVGGMLSWINPRWQAVDIKRRLLAAADMPRIDRRSAQDGNYVLDPNEYATLLKVLNPKRALSIGRAHLKLSPKGAATEWQTGVAILKNKAAGKSERVCLAKEGTPRAHLLKLDEIAAFYRIGSSRLLITEVGTTKSLAPFSCDLEPDAYIEFTPEGGQPVPYRLSEIDRLIPAWPKTIPY